MKLTLGLQEDSKDSKKLILIIYTLISLVHVAVCFEPITIGVTAAVGLGIGATFFKEQIYCRFEECCVDRHIPTRLDDLEWKLNNKLFGQHIVTEQLMPALRAHFSANSKSRKPLVISFHGTPGTGKNFVADQIATAIYDRGLKSKFVHKYLGRADFPVAEQASIYKQRISKDVREGIANCPRSLFIFDEVDKMPSGVFESLTSLLDYHTFVDGLDYTKAVFIFLSNAAGVHISDNLGKLIKDGILREDTKLSHFEALLEKAAYNLEGGMKKTSLIEAHVIDHYIPFLPLEKSHVVRCLNEEFQQWGRRASTELIEDIIKSAITYERVHGLFATSGCKTLEKKVAVAVMSENKHN